MIAEGLYLYSSTFNELLLMAIASGIPKNEEIFVISLVLLLSLKEILRKSKIWNRYLATSLDIAIYPLLFIYCIIIFFKVSNIVADI
jgi:hypothetical protein